ncbi:type IV secretion system protein, partial [Patescibacteria group bacterium]|nr:type IV secretion system protein [Patescibacteria group bacterium]
MPKFFPQILKQKKIIFFIVLFSVVTGLLVPIITRAEISLENGFSLIYIDLMRFISGLFQKYADISSLLLGKVIAELIEAPITTSTLVLSGWGMVRDLANMLIVLGFVIIGIATTLRIRDYEAKKLLPYLIIIALLINFSPLIIGVIIDSSTLAMNSLMGGGALSGKFGRGIYLDINVPYYELFVDAYSQLAATEKQDFTIKVIMFSFMFFIIGTTFLYYVFIFFERYIMLLILSIISPLAFFAWIFPATRKHFNNWVEQLIKWAFIGIAGAFFINIATGLLNLYEQNKTDIIPTDLLHSPDLFYLVNVCLLLFIGLKVTKKNSGVIAGSIMGLAGTAVGMAAGYATGGASLLAKGGLKAAGRGADAATGGRLSATGQKISSGVGRTMERMGLRKEGVTGMKEGG